MDCHPPQASPRSPSAAPADAPPTPARAKRTIIVKVKYNAAEHARVRDQAAATCTPLARCIREASLGLPLPARRSVPNDAAVRALSQLGAELRQLREEARPSEDRSALDTLDQVLAAVCDAIREL